MISWVPLCRTNIHRNSIPPWDDFPTVPQSSALFFVLFFLPSTLCALRPALFGCFLFLLFILTQVSGRCLLGSKKVWPSVSSIMIFSCLFAVLSVTAVYCRKIPVRTCAVIGSPVRIPAPSVSIVVCLDKILHLPCLMVMVRGSLNHLCNPERALMLPFRQMISKVF